MNWSGQKRIFCSDCKINFEGCIKILFGEYVKHFGECVYK